MTPQIGDSVTVRYRGRKDTINGLVIQGSEAPVHTAIGILGVEMTDDTLVGLIIEETDGGTTSVPRSTVLTMEVTQ